MAETAKPTITHYYFCHSPWACLGVDSLMAVAARTGATVDHRPLLARDIFPNSGGVTMKDRHPVRLAYRLRELRRWKSHLGLDAFVIQPAFFPVDERLASLVVVAARQAGHDVTDLTRRLLRAVWMEERDIADAATVVEILGAADLPADALMAAADNPGTAARLKADAEEALAAGVFGAPTYRVGDDIFWGQDRLGFVEQALTT